MVQLPLIPACCVSGQAAGTAAVLAQKQGVSPRRLDIQLLQKTLTQQGMEI